MRRILGAAALAVLGATAARAADPVRLIPHRAVYELTLAQPARALDGARGRIVFDFSGDACIGYTQQYRQVTVLESGESGTRTSDLRNTSFESGDGNMFRFRTDSRVNDAEKPGVDGEADRDGGRLDIRLRQPVPGRAEEAGEVLFPTAHLKRVIEAARAGRSTLDVKVFDGSDDGRKVYDSLAVIGRRIDGGGGGDAIEEAARQPGLAKDPRWPATISYFAPGQGERTPVYTIAFELYENGVSRALKLDYGGFSLAGRLQSLEMRALSDCAR